MKIYYTFLCITIGLLFSESSSSQDKVLPDSCVFEIQGSTQLLNTTENLPLQKTPSYNNIANNKEFDNVATLFIPPVAKFTPADVACRNKEIAFINESTQAGPATLVDFTWNFGDGSPVVTKPYDLYAPNNNAIHTYTATGTYTVRLTARNSSGETHVYTQTITVYATPNIPSTVDKFTAIVVCRTATLTGNFTIDDGTDALITYRWYFADNTPDAYGKTVVHTFDEVKSYLVGLTAISNRGCEETAYQQVQMTPAPNAFFSATDVCYGLTTQFTDYSQPPPNMSSIIAWQWNFGDGNSSSEKNPSHKYAAPGSYDVSLTVTTDEGCVSPTSAVRRVSVTLKVNSDFDVAGPACQGEPITITPNASYIPVNGGPRITQYHWNFSGKDSVRNDGTAFDYTFNDTSGNSIPITLWAQASDGCIGNPVTKTVHINPAPRVDFTVPSLCLPNAIGNFQSTTTIVGNDTNRFNYFWDFDNGFTHSGPGLSGKTVNNVSFNDTRTYNVKLRVTSFNGCAAERTKPVTPTNASATAAFVHSGLYCTGKTIAFTSNSTFTNGNPYTGSFNWDFGDGGTAVTENPTHNFATPGPKTVTLTIGAGGSCAAISVSQQINVFRPATAIFTATPDICSGKPLNITDQSIGNGGNIIGWVWDFGNGTWNTLPSAIVTPPDYTISGAQTIRLRLVTDNGCGSDTATRSVQIHPVPVANFTEPVICYPSGNANFVNTSSITNPAVNTLTYIWRFNDGSPDVTTTSPTHHYNTAPPFSTTLIATSAAGCADTVTKNITDVYNDPIADFMVTANNCINQNINFIDNSNAGTNDAIAGWRWAFGDGGTATIANPGHSFSTANSFTTQLIVTTLHGCTDTVTKPINVAPLPVAQFTHNGIYCNESPISFTDGSAAGTGRTLTRWFMDYGDGNRDTLTNYNSVIHRYTNGTAFNASLRVMNDFGCISPVFTSPVLLGAQPNVTINNNRACLLNTTTQFTSTALASGAPVSSYLWSFGDAAAGNNSSTQPNPAHTFSSPGNYNIQLIAYGTGGCNDTIAYPLSVQLATLAPRFNLVNTGSLCGITNIQIEDATTLNMGNITQTELLWDINNAATTIIDNNPAIGKLYTHNYPAFSMPERITYNIRYTVSLAPACSQTYNSSVELLAQPVISLPVVNEVCADAAPFSIAVPSVQPGFTGNGLFSGPGTTSAGVFNPQIAGAGLHNLNYTFTGTNGCSSTRQFTAMVNPVPVAYAGPDKVTFIDDSVQLTPRIITNMPVNYNWMPPTWLQSNTIPTPYVVRPQKDITYTLQVISDKGCSSNDDVFVKVLAGPIIPNIFSPNGDGVHDTWYIEYLDLYASCELKIFNRYGQMVRYFSDYKIPWDGRINGRDAPIGTYYYILNPKNGKKPVTGWVDIIR